MNAGPSEHGVAYCDDDDDGLESPTEILLHLERLESTLSNSSLPGADRAPAAGSPQVVAAAAVAEGAEPVLGVPPLMLLLTEHRAPAEPSQPAVKDASTPATEIPLSQSASERFAALRAADLTRTLPEAPAAAAMRALLSAQHSAGTAPPQTTTETEPGARAGLQMALPPLRELDAQIAATEAALRCTDMHDGIRTVEPQQQRDWGGASTSASGTLGSEAAGGRARGDLPASPRGGESEGHAWGGPASPRHRLGSSTRRGFFEVPVSPPGSPRAGVTQLATHPLRPPHRFRSGSSVPSSPRPNASTSPALGYTAPLRGQGSRSEVEAGPFSDLASQSSWSLGGGASYLSMRRMRRSADSVGTSATSRYTGADDSSPRYMQQTQSSSARTNRYLESAVSLQRVLYALCCWVRYCL